MWLPARSGRPLPRLLTEQLTVCQMTDMRLVSQPVSALSHVSLSQRFDVICHAVTRHSDA